MRREIGIYRSVAGQRLQAMRNRSSETDATRAADQARFTVARRSCAGALAIERIVAYVFAVIGQSLAGSGHSGMLRAGSFFHHFPPEADKVKQAGFIGIAIAAIALSAPSAYAEEWSEPDYNGPPERFYQDTQVTMLSSDPSGQRNVKNAFVIGHAGSQGMPFYIYVSVQNLHMCSVSGYAAAVAPVEWVFKSLACEIKFRRQGRNAMRVSATLDCDNQFSALPASFGSRVFLGK
ncbi:hypothetical protein [Ralstonia pseudosolanacearum]|nr:hypothetical protein [Ralstonia pseudosolanacearum]MDO3507388.1 hypothetical protein [Ralstonia pseudosolanacearum]MDO3512792.1 hypothetical protein [Ralstonia pseudosolanacearum]MDO3537162.1 hypothetical protein [Ralstonia pseudosolanacearum]MDO3608291.1 hypothetical protein [Ralstonia pseudosolanacearum]MDO3610828.1 hypothetical protein [Ralstonia pseudosolanacearum]